MQFTYSKTELYQLNATPDKKMFWSIISDYDLRTAICELIDNSIDVWNKSDKKTRLEIRLYTDEDTQTIRIEDTAGGVDEAELRHLVSPGSSNNDPTGKSIGVFGVGSKRAVVALAAQTSIQTRKGSGKSFQIDVNDAWLAEEGWDIPVYEIPSIDNDTTTIELFKLRTPLRKDDVDLLERHVRETYALFLEDARVSISLNGTPLNPIKFDAWAFPPNFEPIKVESVSDFQNSGVVFFRVTGGLIRDREPNTENYGVYIYCNNRLVAQEVKSRDVGYYNSAEAGVPHPDASICRVIVELDGPARLMPWTSAKNAVNPENPTFRAVRPTIVRLLSHFTTLSRRTKNSWDVDVFSHTAGEIRKQELDDVATPRKLNLAPLPRARKGLSEQLKADNLETVTQQPWTLGFIEAIIATDVLKRQRFDTANRMALIFLDSTFEIALKEYLVHSPADFPIRIYNDEKIKQIFNDRRVVIREIASKVRIPDDLLRRANHYYGLRNKLIHERATASVTDNDIRNYREVIERVLEILFGLRFS
ncbi:ATP-binding protein [Luteibacter sp. Lutesp34]|uniref:ATP-binding protein n=1 Tax=Luteibacter sp. Lutesp34 TaxID=3243030 RepID=UPI0039B6C8E3